LRDPCTKTLSNVCHAQQALPEERQLLCGAEKLFGGGRAVGYWRYDTEEELAVLNELYDRLRLYTNFFQFT
jgi:hypothetical protein